MTSELLYIIVIYSGVALLTDIYPEHDPHVSKHSFMTHMICIRMLSQILDSADTTRFLDLFRIPVSRAEFDDSNKHSFFSHVFTKDSYLFLHQFLPFFPSIPQNRRSQA